MKTKNYRVSLEKEQLVFSSAHFITFAGNICERLHGHNYRVKCEVVGSLDENGYVIDFIALRDSLLAIVTELDHHVLLPTEHPTIKVTPRENEVEANFENKRWIFPAEDCRLLPVANTTAELLANYIGQELVNRAGDHLATATQLLVSVDENHGQWGTCEIEI